MPPTTPPVRKLSWLRVPWPRTLWPRLVLLLVAAMAPLLGLLFVSVVSDANRVIGTARQQAADAARLGAGQQQEMLAEAASLLRVLARMPAVQAADQQPCRAVLEGVVDDLPRVAALSVADAQGTVRCSTNAASLGLGIGDRDWFRRALGLRGPGQYALSELATSRVTGQPTLFMAVPLLPSEPGLEPGGVVVAALNLDWFGRLHTRMLSAGAQLVQVMDSRDGAMLAREPDTNHLVGLRFPDYELIRAFRAAPRPGTITGPDLDGQERIFGYAPLAGPGDGLLISVGVSMDAVRREADLRVRKAMAVAVAVAGIAVALSWLLAQRMLVQPLRTLSAAAAELGSGDMSSAVVIHEGVAWELRALAATMARMAKRLQVRDSRIEAMQQQLAASESNYRLLTDAATDMITRFSTDLRRVYVSPACRDLLGYEPEELLGNLPGSIVHPDDWERLNNTLNLPLLAGQPTARATYRAFRKDGAMVWLESAGRAVPDGTGFVVVTRDVSERMALEKQLADANRKLRVLVRLDGLTGLANRRRFDELLGREYARAMRERTSLAVIMLDVDRFKLFNDTYGHPTGDACLQAVAAAMEGALRRGGDVAARYGGEEFAILLCGGGIGDAAEVAERVRDAIRALGVVHAASEWGVVTVSIGAAVIEPHPGDAGPAQLVEAADAALYRAKHEGRNTVRFAGEGALRPG